MFMTGPDSASETLVAECSFVPKKCHHVHISSPESSLCFLFAFPDALLILLLFRTITPSWNVCLLFIHEWKRKRGISIRYTGNTVFRNTLHIGFEGTHRNFYEEKKIPGSFKSTARTGNRNRPVNVKWLPRLVQNTTWKSMDSCNIGYI